MNNEFPVSGRDNKIRVDYMFGITGYDRKGENSLFDYRRKQQDADELAANLDADEIPHVVWVILCGWFCVGGLVGAVLRV